MVSIFAREVTGDLTSLVKKIDAVVAQHKDEQMAAFMVLLTDDPDAAELKLQKLAKEHGIQNVPLTVFDGPAGPPQYKIAKDADVTVMLWRRTEVKANHAFAKGELNGAAIEKIVGDTAKILQ